MGLLQGWHHLAFRGGRRMTTILLFHCRCSHWHKRIISTWAGNCQDRLSVILQPRSGAGSPAPLSGEFLCSLHKAGQPQRKKEVEPIPLEGSQEDPPGRCRFSFPPTRAKPEVPPESNCCCWTGLGVRQEEHHCLLLELNPQGPSAR